VVDRRWPGGQRAGSAVRHHDDTDVVPWDQALQVIDGISYLRPELALLHKAHLDRPKDRGDLAAARLQPEVRAWLADTLDELGHHDWAGLARSSDSPEAS
jgi:hypothetical protein